MHQAYESYSLTNLSTQIESISAFDDNLLIGTRQGSLFMYNRVLEENDKYSLQLKRLNKTFSKKGISQLEVIPEYELLISLTENIVQVHDLNEKNFNVICQLPRTKGATHFTLNMKKETSLTGEGTLLVRMAVVVKRKLQLYFLKNRQFNQFGDDISLSEIPKSLIWSQETICVGYKGEYALIDLNDDRKQKELFPTSGSRSSEPCMAAANNKAFALCRDSQTVLVNNKGETEVTTALKWSDIPVALAWDEPYALAALPDKVEVKTPDASDVTQCFKDMGKIRFLVPCHQGLVYAASATQVWIITAVDVQKQRKLLLEAKQFQLALKLTAISKESEEDKKEKVHQIQTLLAYDLFANKHFHDSMKEFCKLKTDPYNVIRLFPELLPQQANESQNSLIPSLEGKDLETGLLALIDYLTDIRHPLKLEVSSENEAKSKHALQLLQIIDTTLLKCYLQTNEALVAPLLRLNYCHLAEAEKVLKKMGKHNDLVILYQTKHQHRKALELLKNEKEIEKTIKYLQHLGSDQVGLVLEFGNWVLSEAPEEGLQIFTEDVQEVEPPPRPRVLDFLLRFHPNCVIPYLEHVVHVWKDTNPLFHNALVHQYRERAAKDKSELSQKILWEFLEKSQNYTPESVLTQFPTEDRLRALILGRLGRHDEALSIFVRHMGDMNEALNYCSKVYAQPRGASVYVSLLKLILNPDATNIVKKAQPDLEFALKILQENASKIDPLEALACLPDHVPVTRICSFLLVSLQKVIAERRKAELLKGLLYAENLQCQELKFRLQAQKVLVSELNVCPVCKKRFGNQSALIRYPNGDVVHYSCQEKKN